MSERGAGGTTTAASDVVRRKPAAGERAWPWLLRVLALVAAFALVAWLRSRQVDIPFRDPAGKLFRAKLPSTALAVLVLIVLDVVVGALRSGPARSTAPRAWALLRERWTPARIGLSALALVAYYVVYLCYRNLKSWDVLNAPKDDMLLRWDRALFLGHSPAVLLHDALGQDVAARTLTVVYESFPTLVTLSLAASLAFTPRVREGCVFVVAAMWAWIIGVGSYYLIPSLGPFHSAPEEFAGLTRTSIQHTQAEYADQRTYLLAHPHASDAFAQISAFASLHCALSCLIWLMARYYGLRRLSWLLALFLLGTLLATVYLGWHFAVDDVAGLAIAWISVRLGRLVVHGRRGSAPETPAAA